MVRLIGKLTVLLLAGVVLAAFATSAAAAKSPRQIVQGALPSVVVLVTQDANGWQLSLGSGFFVRDGVIAANLHLLEGAHGGYYKHVGYSKKFPIEGILGIDRQHDLVLLAAPGAAGPGLALGNSEGVGVGDPVYVVGNPGGLEGTLSQGIVSGIRQVGSQSLLQITAPLSAGSSGSPVLNDDGKVIGIATATAGTGQNLNFAVSVSFLRALLADMRPVMPLAAFAGAGESESPPPVARHDERGGDALVGTLFTWNRYGYEGRYYSFSLRNLLPRPVKDVYYRVEFSDRAGDPVDVQTGYYAGVIPAGLAKRVSGALEVYTSDLAEKVNIKVISFALAE